MKRFAAPIAIALIVGWLLPEAAAACAVCVGGEERSRSAFILTTVLLSVLPIAMIGGLVWVVLHSERRIEAASRAVREGPATGARSTGHLEPAGTHR